MRERRRHPRIRFAEPLRGAVGSARVDVIDASPAGLAVAHELPLFEPGQICRVELESDVGPIRLDCAVVRITPFATDDGIHFQTGFQVLAADHQSAARLRSVGLAGR